MTQATAKAVAITQTLTRVMRDDRGRLVSALMHRLRDLQLAEDVLQEAAMSALTHWGRAGLPDNPQGWLLKVALRRAIDRLRAQTRSNRNVADLAILAEEEASDPVPDVIPDHRLRLIFTCCHPALEPKSRVALTLRSLGGLSTAAIAAAFLDAEPTMGQRLSRAKTKITAARIPFAIPDPQDWPERLHSVLTVVYLIFTTGYALGPIQGHDLCDEALFLARLLNQLAPADAEIEGCLALILLTHARRAARLDGQGALVALTDQDRSRWDHAQIAAGLPLVETALRRHRLGPFQIKAAIAACHVQGAAPDWPQIAALYGQLAQFEPTAVVALNHAVALAESGALPQAMAMLAPLSAELDSYQPYHAACAELHARTGNHPGAQIAYTRAIDLAAHPADAAFLHERQKKLPH